MGRNQATASSIAASTDAAHNPIRQSPWGRKRTSCSRQRRSLVMIGCLPVIRASPSVTSAAGQSTPRGLSLGGLRPTRMATSARFPARSGSRRRECSARRRGRFLRRAMPGGNVIDVHDVEAGIDVSRHPAAAARGSSCRRCRLDVAWPDRGRRIDHHRRQPLLAHQIHHRAFGQKLRALVGADEVRLVGGRGLVGRFASCVQPSAATELQCTIRSTPAACAARITASVPLTLARSIASGSGTQKR